MTILEFDREEFEEAIEIGKKNLEQDKSQQTIEEYIAISLESLLFLGRNIKDKPELLDVAIFNIRLCYTYYTAVEDYRKIANIVTLVNELEAKADKVVDSTIIDEITINLN
jgi:hypothetical protein